MPRFQNRTLIIVAAAVAALVTLAALLLWPSSSSKPVAAPEPTRSVQTAVPVPTAARTAQPRPTEPVKHVQASKKCTVLLDQVRAFMDKHESGLTLDTKAAKQMTAYLGQLTPAAGNPCTASEISAFQAQEMTPWLTYAPKATTAAAK